MNALIIQVEHHDWYGGHNVKINGIQVAHRPYDGSHSDTVEMEIAEALGSVLRKELGWEKEPPPPENDW